MELFYIILLVVLGLLFLVAELVLLPGVSVGALLAWSATDLPSGWVSVISVRRAAPSWWPWFSCCRLS